MRSQSVRMSVALVSWYKLGRKQKKFLEIKIFLEKVKVRIQKYFFRYFDTSLYFSGRAGAGSDMYRGSKIRDLSKGERLNLKNLRMVKFATNYWYKQGFFDIKLNLGWVRKLFLNLRGEDVCRDLLR